MRIQSITSTLFKGKPNNYAKIDEHVSRSAQPLKEDLTWLKEQGITDVINFRTMYAPAVDFDEAEELKKLGIRYHNIPTVTMKPNEEKIHKFLNIINNVIENNGKAHIHCKAGADRTGMYAFIYKTVKNIGTIAENEVEWLKFGHNKKLYPNLQSWTKEFVKKLK
jgi:protein tyrosine phosphatase (PTP) superfamily phosphohydrolase (DUF442 family)